MTGIARTLARIEFGSSLYGTRTPNSDLDYKSVFVPSAQSILLQRVKDVHSHQRPKAEGERNVAGDIDEERFSIQRYLGLLAEGQTVSLDVLFAPDWAHVQPATWEWREIVKNRHRLVTKKSKAFVGYCMNQAAKFGIKGSRVAAARAALTLLAAGVISHGRTAKLRELDSAITPLLADSEHMGWTDIPSARGDERHWEVCGRKLPLSASIGSAHDIMAKLVEGYGHRALMAESQQGVDWKALSHAVRIATQAIELLSTAHISFPRPEAEHLIAIKTGQLLYQDVAAEIEDLLVRVEAAALTSALPEAPDLDWIDTFVANVHRREVFA